MIDHTGSVIIELRDDAAFGSWCEERVRGEEPGPGDVEGQGSFRRFAVVMSQPALPREKRTPVQYPRLLVRCYGTSPKDAMTGYGYATDALHRLSPRLRANGYGIYLSFDDTGGQPGADPRTKQPYVEFAAQLIATTEAVA